MVGILGFGTIVWSGIRSAVLNHDIKERIDKILTIIEREEKRECLSMTTGSWPYMLHLHGYPIINAAFFHFEPWAVPVAGCDWCEWRTYVVLPNASTPKG